MTATHSTAAAGPTLDPEAFLRACPGGAPRGAWVHAGRWAVFGGVAQRFAVGTGSDRFQRLADAVGGLSPGETGAAPRVFGGAAFGAAAPGDACWQGFGPGTFVLPAVAAFGGPDGVELVAWTDDGDPRARLDAFAAAALAQAPPVPSARAAPLPARVDAYTAWGDAVRAVLEAIARGEVHKVVLARALDVRFPAVPDPTALFAGVRADNPGATVYFLEPQPGTVLLGAAPEVLVTLEGTRFLTTAVAGSTARGATGAEDERLAARLLASPKERAEHGFGVDDIVSRLSPFTETVDIESQPRVLRLHRIQHLQTDIRADVAPGCRALDLVGALHPTAAVCGAPREAAASLLARVEALDRGWYAGPVGWTDAVGNGEFAPALRCAVGQGRMWRLFAGAGIVAGSDPDREWSETTMKFQPMLHALGAGGSA